MRTNRNMATISAQLLAKSERPIEDNPVRLEHQLDTDLQENLPPQLLAVVVGVLKMVEGLDQEEKMVIREGNHLKSEGTRLKSGGKP